MNVLVTGGAGYVGSIVAEELLKEGYKVIIVDNLQQGHQEAVLPEVEFIRADIGNFKALDEAFQRFRIDAVMHMAAETVVEYSMTAPGRYFQNNVVGGLNLLEVMLMHNVHRLVFSSSAAVYGEPKTIPIEEDHPKAPTNAYGESKLMFERILQWYGTAYGLKFISLRYFNAAGASLRLGEDHCPETHLIPNVLRVALGQASEVPIFGEDYPTKDGSCVRDYVHVLDIARAHILALNKLDDLSGKVCNLGNGHGYSVNEVLEVARRVTGAEIGKKACARRQGDPAVLVASSELAKSELGWEPKYPRLESIIESAWEWMRMHPNGY